jgi:hypothetical protein
MTGAAGPAVLAVATHPGAPSRRPEVAAVLAAARGLLGPSCTVTAIVAPGTLEGGDVIVYGDRAGMPPSLVPAGTSVSPVAGIVTYLSHAAPTGCAAAYSSGVM